MLTLNFQFHVNTKLQEMHLLGCLSAHIQKKVQTSTKLGNA